MPAAAAGRAALVLDVGLVLVAEVAQRRQHRVGRRLAEAAERRLPDHLAQARQPVQVVGRASPLRDGGQHVEHLARADPAGHALAARLALREGQEEAGDVHHAGGVVDDDHAARAHDRAGGAQVLVVDARVEHARRDAAAGRPAHLHGLEGAAVAAAAADLEDHLAQRHADRHLDQAGCWTAPVSAKAFVPPLRCGAQAGEPVRPVEEDAGHAGVGLDVVDVGRVAPEPGHRRIGRAHAGHAALALDRVHQRGLLAADEGAGAFLDDEVEVQPAAQDVLAQEAVRLRLVDRFAQRLDGQRVLGPDVEVAALAPMAWAAIIIPSSTRCGSPSIIVRSMNAPGSPSSALQTTYLTGARRLLARLSAHFWPVGKPAPPRPRQVSIFDRLDDRLRGHRERHPQRPVAVVRQVVVERVGVDDAAELGRHLDLAAQEGVVACGRGGG